MDPINYGALQTQVDLSPLQRGLQLRTANRAEEALGQQRMATQQLAQRKFEIDLGKEQEYNEAIAEYKMAPSSEALRDLGIRFPEHQKQLQDAGDSYTSRQKQDMIGSGFSALGALSANKPDLAVKTLTDRITALKGGGIDTTETQAAVDMIKNGDIKGATAYLSYAMGGLVGADHAASVLETLGAGGKAEDRRADNERAERKLAIDERRVTNTERATTAAIAGRSRDDARADRKAAGGGSGGKKSSGNASPTRSASLPAGFKVD